MDPIIVALTTDLEPHAFIALVVLYLAVFIGALVVAFAGDDDET